MNETVGERKPGIRDYVTGETEAPAIICFAIKSNRDRLFNGG